MGWHLAEEVQRHAPDSLTYRELYVATVLAQDARDTTRQCPPGIEHREDMMQRLRLSRTQFYVVLAALVAKGVLIHAVHGQRNVTGAVYKIAEFGAAQGPENRDSDSPDRATAQGPVNRDTDDSQGPGSAFSESRKPGPLPVSPVSKNENRQARERDRVENLTDAYAAAAGACNRPKARRIVRQVLAADRWTDTEIQAALTRLPPRWPLSEDTLLRELNGPAAGQAATPQCQHEADEDKPVGTCRCPVALYDRQVKAGTVTPGSGQVGLMWKAAHPQDAGRPRSKPRAGQPATVATLTSVEEMVL